jgi:Flp pilus assembly protein TadG
MPMYIPRFRLVATLGRSWTDERGSQIVEFALSLPLLVVFVVGIFDFSGAISLKQKLTNAAREGARVAATDPANDLGNGSTTTVPASVADAFQVVDNYLASENIAPCGLSVGTFTPTGLTWVFTATGSPCGTTAAFVLTINRGCVQKVSSVNLVSTCVTIQYPYKWQFSSVTSLVGGKFTGPTSITTNAIAFNEN